MLFRKLWRTIGLYKAQFISMMIMIALGLGVFVGFHMEWVSIRENTNRFYEETGFADERIVSFEELEPEERVFCSLLSNLVLGVPLVVISLIAGAM